MTKYFSINIDSLISTFSLLEAGKEVEFSVNTDNSNFKEKGISVNDLIIATVEDRIYYNFIVTDTNDEIIKLKKTFEIEKSIGEKKDTIGIFEAISKEEYEKLCSKLFINFVEKDLVSDKLTEFRNVKENFADWLIKQNGSKNSYFENFFGADKNKLIENLSKYDEVYIKEFGKSVFTLPKNSLSEFINELEKNLYRDSGEFYSFSEKRSTHMPRAILGNDNYIKFLREFLKINSISQIDFNLKEFNSISKTSGLIYSDLLLLRFIASLFTKPFVILTGLSGSGKTKLAQAFAMWICESKDQYCIIPVGADWTNREPLLGFPNALKSDEYVKPDNKVLDLIITAIENPVKPHFLILDEMNLSHVERYFADFLSVMETNKKIFLHTGNAINNNVPLEVELPKNLFIIGTVNIDETTYMFSPKVLDRANVIEFRVTFEDMKGYLESSTNLNLNELNEKGKDMAEDFVKIAIDRSLILKNKSAIGIELLNFFKELKKSGAEFGYRSASEILRFAAIVNKIEPDWSDKNIIDAAIMQKLLPKVHGSRKKLEPVLRKLGELCTKDPNEFDEILKSEDEDIYSNKGKYPISLEKICRMYKNLMHNGFTSYAEA